MLRRFQIPCVATLVLGLCAASAMAGKPTPPPPPPSPVKYMVKTFQMPVPSDVSSGVETHQMTSSGVVVGGYRVNGDYHPFMYNTLIDADTAIDLNDFTSVGMPEVVGLEPGWRIAAALDINEFGYVVGAMCHVDTPKVWRGYLLDLNTSPPQLSPLPDGSEHTYARRINDRMDILGVTPNAVSNRAYLYNPLLDSQTHDLGIDVWQTVELSNAPIGQPAKVAGRLVNGDAFRYTAGAGLDAGFGFEGNAIDINPSGKVCGNYRWGRKSTNIYAFRFGTNFEPFSGMKSASAIDDHGDFVTSDQNFTLYHEGTGLLNLETAVDGPLVVGPLNDLDFWRSSTFRFYRDMTERGAMNAAVLNFPAICGHLSILYGESRGFILVPITPPTP